LRVPALPRTRSAPLQGKPGARLWYRRVVGSGNRAGPRPPRRAPGLIATFSEMSNAVMGSDGVAA